MKTKKYSKNVLTKKKRRFLVLSSLLAVSILTFASVLAMNQENYLNTFISGLGGRAAIVNRPIANTPANAPANIPVNAPVNAPVAAKNQNSNINQATGAETSGRVANRVTNPKAVAQRSPNLIANDSAVATQNSVNTEPGSGDGTATKVGETQNYTITTENAADPNSFYQQWWAVGINAEQADNNAPAIQDLEEKGYKVYYEEANVTYSTGMNENADVDYTVRKYYAIDPNTGEKWTLDYGQVSTASGDGYYMYKIDDSGNKVYATDDDGWVTPVSTVSDAEYNASFNPYKNAPVSGTVMMGDESTRNNNTTATTTATTATTTQNSSESSVQSSTEAQDLSGSSSKSSSELSSVVRGIYPDFSLSDISNVEKTYLGQTSGSGRDVNGDGIFTYADVISLVQCWNDTDCRGEN